MHSKYLINVYLVIYKNTITYTNEITLKKSSGHLSAVPPPAACHVVPPSWTSCHPVGRRPTGRDPVGRRPTRTCRAARFGAGPADAVGYILEVI